MLLRISTPKEEGVLQVSKAHKIQVLLDVEEMRSLLMALEPFSIWVASEPVVEPQIAKEEFLRGYGGYVDALKRGDLPDEKALRHLFSSLWTADESILYAIALSGPTYLVKPLLPVIQLQAHHFLASKVDGKLYPLVFGKESITWGVQFSYPQIYQDPKSKEIHKVGSGANSKLFATLMQWMRRHTTPSSWLFQGKKVVSPMRIGRACKAWIHNHPQLREHGLS